MGDNSHSSLRLDVSEGQLPWKPVPAPQTPAHCGGADLHGPGMSWGGGATPVQRGHSLVEGIVFLIFDCSAQFVDFIKGAISMPRGRGSTPVKRGHSLVEDNLDIRNI